MTTPDSALQRVLGILEACDEPDNVKMRVLALQWPSLAAALGALMAANSLPVPRSLRYAQQAMATEARLTLVPMATDGERLAVPAQPPENGPWCFCPRGPNADGRGHLAGEAGCTARVIAKRNTFRGDVDE